MSELLSMLPALVITGVLLLVVIKLAYRSDLFLRKSDDDYNLDRRSGEDRRHLRRADPDRRSEADERVLKNAFQDVVRLSQHRNPTEQHSNDRAMGFLSAAG